MEFTLGLAQTCHPEDGDVVALVDRMAAQAAARGVDLLVFPESLMTSYELPVEEFLASAQPVDGPFVQAVCQVAARHGLWLVFTLNEQAEDGGKPFNTAVVASADGCVAGTYRKAHLFEAGPYSESSKMQAGSGLFEPIQTPFCTLGLGICYDLRFPEVARWAAVRGAELMVYPAAWVAGEMKAHQWKTLLAARAIENEFFVAGLSRADAPRYIGQSCVFGPLGECLASSGPYQDLLVCRVDTSRIAAARENMPILDHLRPELY
ncbi:MAG: nitrilase-related carbon-nitrogen hydrolase [Coriobacteriia bacterium]|nr:nitrilase-related carbon-nitrogen hydrolase [Coriobacteriia bacterium]